MQMPSHVVVEGHIYQTYMQLFYALLPKHKKCHVNVVWS